MIKLSIYKYTIFKIIVQFQIAYYKFNKFNIKKQNLYLFFSNTILSLIFKRH